MSQVVFVEAQIVAIMADRQRPPIVHLNHDMLVSKGVVAQDRALQPGQSVSTDVVSRLHYTDGLKIVSEPQRLTLVMPQQPQVRLDALKGVAQKCIALCQQPQAIGINFLLARDDMSYKVFADKFLHSLPHFDDKEAKAHQLAWSYKLGQSIKLNIEVLEANKQGLDEAVAFFRANIHYAGNTTNALDELEKNHKSLLKFIGNI